MLQRLFTLSEETKPLHIVWNHRWEHDKDPDTFFQVLIDLHNAHIPVNLSVLGESFDEVPQVGVRGSCHEGVPNGKRRSQRPHSPLWLHGNEGSLLPYSPKCGCLRVHRDSRVLRRIRHRGGLNGMLLHLSKPIVVSDGMQCLS